MRKRIDLPLKDEQIADLKAGEEVALNGVVYTARDAAHRRFMRTLEHDESLPIELYGQTIFYAGPSPAPPGRVIGSIGPTTSRRMDRFTTSLLELGLKGMIGKGDRSREVKEAIVRQQAVYFVTPGGVAAYMSQFVTKAEVVAYDDLGTEAVYRLVLADFPAVVGIDAAGESIFDRV